MNTIIYRFLDFSIQTAFSKDAYAATFIMFVMFFFSTYVCKYASNISIMKTNELLKDETPNRIMGIAHNVVTVVARIMIYTLTISEFVTLCVMIIVLLIHNIIKFSMGSNIYSI